MPIAMPTIPRTSRNDDTSIRHLRKWRRKRRAARVLLNAVIQDGERSRTLGFSRALHEPRGPSAPRARAADQARRLPTRAEGGSVMLITRSCRVVCAAAVLASLTI